MLLYQIVIVTLIKIYCGNEHMKYVKIPHVCFRTKLAQLISGGIRSAVKQ